MKKVIFSILILAFAFTLNAQVVSVVKPVFEQVHYSRLNTTGDSSWTAIDLAYRGTDAGLFNGQQPDSIRIQWFTDGDSTASYHISFKAGIEGSGIYTSTILDSVYAATAIAAQGTKLVTREYFNGYDKVNLAVKASLSNAKAPALTANAPEITVRLVFYYKVQAYRP